MNNATLDRHFGGSGIEVFIFNTAESAAIDGIRKVRAKSSNIKSVGAAGDFLPSEGGTLCKNCLGLNSPRYTESFLEDLRKFHKKESLPDAQALEKAFFFYLKTHLGENRDINSFNWLNEVRKICSPQKK